MKLFIVLAVVSLSSCAKLDRTYLPPHAQTSGGSGNFLQTPVSGPNDFGSAGNGFDQGGNDNGFAPNNGFGQKGFAQGNNNVPQGGDNYPQNGNDFAQNGNEYQENDFSQNGNSFAPNANFDDSNSGFGNGFDRPERPQAAFERNAAILRQDSQNDGETYSYSYETENGIFAEENGVATNGVEAQGGFSYTGDDGQVYSIRYTADQNGFVPQGDHIPTPPPVPEEILKALEQNARDEANGIFDDGSYQEGKYADDDGNQYNGNGNNNYGSDNGNFVNNDNGNFANNNGNNNFGSENGNFANNNGKKNFGSDNGNFANNNGNNNFGGDNGNFANTNGNQNFPGNFNGNSGDAVVTNSAAYLPPVENRRSGNSRPESGLARPQFAARPSGNAQPSANYGAAGNFRAPSGSFNVQPSANFAPSNGITGATNAYLPPRDQPRGPARLNAQNGPQRSSNFGTRSSPRRPSFNARDGYQY